MHQLASKHGLVMSRSSVTVPGCLYPSCVCTMTATATDFDCSMCIAEHEGVEATNEVLGHQDSSEWSLVDSDVDEHEQLLRQ